ncbi:steroid 17-alpha-hydroxylase/17,20 lyase isoform X2 [Anguilla anguilla]|uniref:steroid 17-alpha-hydroxylase/17,20 lyase isoform X2 n=1 Tax=Anguilla anguilla TaxID=7936 RepID=UPI0015A8B1CA|nr:steroid 17-alpha-hydroxylase/17,20 lyase isoform X2 [Anguilla anguilla]
MVGRWTSDEVLAAPAVLLLPALVVLLTVLVVRRVVGRRASAPSLPCLPSLPILGSLLSLREDLPPHLLFTSLGRRYGDLYALYLGPHYTVVVNNFRHAREVLLQKGKEFAGRPKMVTTELLSREGKDIAFADYSPLWKSHRRLVHSSFSMFGEGTSKLQTIVCEEATSLCSDLLTQAGQPLDPGPVLMRAVTNVVCTLVFGSTYQPHDPELKVVMDYNTGIVQTIARGNLVDIFPWLRIFPNKDLKRLKECITVRDELLNRKLEEHKVTEKSRAGCCAGERRLGGPPGPAGRAAEGQEQRGGGVQHHGRPRADDRRGGLRRRRGDHHHHAALGAGLPAAQPRGPGEDPPGAGRADRTRPLTHPGGPGEAALPGEHLERGDEDTAGQPRAHPPRGPAGHQHRRPPHPEGNPRAGEHVVHPPRPTAVGGA